MKLFQRLFNFQPEELEQTERRLQRRYSVGPDFPLALSVAGNGWESDGRVQDMAVGGIGVVLAGGPAVDTGAAVRVSLRLERFQISTPGQLRYVREGVEGGFHCGVSLEFPDSTVRQAYTQLLIPVSIGASLALLDPTLVKQDEPGIRKEVYEGDAAARLTLWRREGERDTAPPFGFEFTMGDHLVRPRPGGAGVQTFSRVNDERPHRITDFAPHAGMDDVMDAELKRLFRWAMFNLRDNVPESARSYLLATARSS
jgi:hypothetical protein